MKRILIFSLSYFPKFYGGAEIAIREITDRIDPTDIEFHMVTLRYDRALPKVEKIGNILVHRIGYAKRNATIAHLQGYPLKFNKYIFQISACLKALVLYRKYRYDGIWAMMAHASGIPAALFKTFVPRIRYLLTLQEGDPPKYIERLARPLWPLFVRAFTKADMVQTISNFLAAWARLRRFTGPLEVIPNGVDTRRFSGVCDAEKIAAVRAAFAKKDADTIVVTTSRLVHKNGIDTVLRALPLLAAPVSFLVVGDGPDEQTLKKLAVEVGVKERVHFVGLVDHRDIPLYLRASDIFVRPSRSEGMGSSFVEAMAAGLPVIGTRQGGIADFLFDGRTNQNRTATGWIVDADQPKQVADAIMDILSNDEKTKKITAHARRLVLERYDWDVVAKSMKEKIFDPLLK